MALPVVNICFSITDSWLSYLIRWAAKSMVSHVLITFHDATLNKVLVLESGGRGFVPLPWSKWRQRNRLVARFALRVPEVRQLTALQTLADHLSDEYDTVNWFAAAFRRWKKRYQNPLSGSKKLICAETTVIYMQLCGVKLGDPATYTPDDLFKLLSSNDKIAARLL